MKNKHSLKDCIEQFFNFPNKNIIHDKIINTDQINSSNEY